MRKNTCCCCLRKGKGTHTFNERTEREGYKPGERIVCPLPPFDNLVAKLPVRWMTFAAWTALDHALSHAVGWGDFSFGCVRESDDRSSIGLQTTLPRCNCTAAGLAGMLCLATPNSGQLKIMLEMEEGRWMSMSHQPKPLHGTPIVERCEIISYFQCRRKLQGRHLLFRYAHRCDA